ncbi:hypothetical protein BDV33DRAFT_185117 [Aspergillus novoparasiticus]|uniref:Uncharacterized protein n=1 Tax=Aspergillus novoparasiticus TaxID=986946 RepID=A0A5N6E915_9EURO|nr:hypothetical protein BDV33DRAFT_185117 [Aspergillus novoparasiticus]
MSPLLQPPHENTHATIISAYLNTVIEMVYQGKRRERTPNIDLLIEFLPQSAHSLKFWNARTIVLGRDNAFDR